MNENMTGRTGTSSTAAESALPAAAGRRPSGMNRSIIGSIQTNIRGVLVSMPANKNTNGSFRGTAARISAAGMAFAVTAALALGVAAPASAAPALPASVTAQVTGVENRQQIRDIFNGINEYRASQGLAPLKISAGATAVAQDWSDHLQDTNGFAHNPGFRKDPRVAGQTNGTENLAGTDDRDGATIVQGWIDSPGHQANLLGADMNTIGIGVGYAAPDSWWYPTIATANFFKFPESPDGTFDTADELFAYLDRTPMAAGAATVTGKNEVFSTLTAAAGQWAPAAADLSYQWLRNGVSIPGATGSEYTLTEDDFSTKVTVRITGTLDGYRTTSSTSPTPANAVSDVSFGHGQPSITGDLTEFREVTVDPTAWTPEQTTFTYQWLRNGSPIAGATAATYELTSEDVGRSMSALVTGSYFNRSETVESRSTRNVAAAPTVANTKAPSIAGTPVAGNELAADAGTWDTGAQLSYQWNRDGQPVDGATGTTYALTRADAGKKISVTVTGTLAYHRANTATSAATAAVTLPKVTNTAKPSIAGTPMVGLELQAGAGTWTDGAALAYQWNAGGTPIAGATAPTYTPERGDAGKAITVTVTGSKTDHESASATSGPTTAVESNEVTNTKAPALAGSPTVGETLTITAGIWAPSTADLTYQWFRSGAPINGATGPTYVLTTEDLGHRITADATGSAANRIPLTIGTDATAAVAATAITNTELPAISGSPLVGQELTATAGAWAPVDVETAWQWFADGEAIQGAIGPVYSPVAADAGKTITVAVTATKADHTALTVTSAATQAVTVPAVANTQAPRITGAHAQGVMLTAVPGVWTESTGLSYQWLRDNSPVAGATGKSYRLTSADYGKRISLEVTGRLAGHAELVVTTAQTPAIIRHTVPNFIKPTITGKTAQGQYLRANPGTWTSDVKLGYQWNRNGAAVRGANGSTYKLTSADYGKRISVSITADKADHNRNVVTTAQTAAVSRYSVVNSKKPSVYGKTVRGQLVKAHTGKWTAGSKLSYQWKRDGKAIKGATKSSYRLGTADVNKRISLTVSAAKADHNTRSVTTGHTAKVVNPKITNSKRPYISGTSKVGKKLYAKAGKWTSGSKLSYQWYRNGKAIKGSTAKKSSYKLVRADKGKRISVKVTAKKSWYTSHSVTSKSTAKIR